MEFRHFSHNHGLIFYQTPQGSEIHCSGCKSPGSGDVYVCWQCEFFLHGQCFRATRSLKHPSHPPHPLTLVPLPTYRSRSFFCNSCNLAGDGFSYSCSACEFDIHVYCALIHNASNPHVLPSPVADPNFNYPIYHPPNPTYPPHNATTIPNDKRNYPPQPQITRYPPIPNNPFPNFTPTNTTPAPNEAQNYSAFHQTPDMHQNPAYPPNQNNPYPAYPQPNATLQNFIPPVNTPATIPAPPNPNATTNNPPPPPTVIKHFSHPHVLKPMEIEQKNSKVLCSACERELSGSAYCCTESHCNFNLHKACFDFPRELRHKSHLEHSLTLVAVSRYSEGRFTCDACGKDGKGFSYSCATCSYDIHMDCVKWPETMTRRDDKHPLTLYYSSAAALGNEMTFTCDVCKNPVDKMGWLYNCRECDFGTHLECVSSEVKQQTDGGGLTLEQLRIDKKVQKAILELWDSDSDSD